MEKNTVLFVEPRIFKECPNLLNHFVNVLGNNWRYVFYCGKNTREYWENTDLNKIYELRELDVINFYTADEYSDFMKQKTLWETLSGEFVLTTQMDTWITHDCGYTIYDFMKLDYSYIGGNMNYPWLELTDRENIHFQYCNFNGGLSLRKRMDMIHIINSFPPEKTSNADNVMNRTITSDAEDVYFTIGCYHLGMKVGCDELSQHFAVHTIFKETFFGIHQPIYDVMQSILNIIPNLQEINPYICK